MTLQEKFKQTWLGQLVIITVLIAACTWAAFDQLLLRPTQDELARLQRKVTDLEERARMNEQPPSSTASEPTIKAPRDQPQLSNTETEADPPILEPGVRETNSHKLTSPRPRQGPSEQFLTESYRLQASSIRSRGSLVDVEFVLESEVSELFKFSISQPYLADSQGTRLYVESASRNAFTDGGAEVLPNITHKSQLSFCIMNRPPTAAYFGDPPHCIGQQVEGHEFVFVADEVSPRRGRKILIRVTNKTATS